MALRAPSRAPCVARRAPPRRPPRAAASSADAPPPRAAFAAASRPVLPLPCLLLTLPAAALPACEAALEAAVAAREGVVLVLSESQGGAGELFDAALRAKSLLRGRSLLLLSERPDVAAACGADGVLLSPQSLPTVAARRALDASRLVIRLVDSPQRAAAAAAEGADACVLPSAAAVRDARRLTSVPLLLSRPPPRPPSGGAAAPVAAADGCVEALEALRDAGDVAARVAALLTPFDAVRRAEPAAAAVSPPPAPAPAPSGAAGDTASSLLVAERDFITSLLSFLDSAAPDMPETALLRASLASLDEPFLVVVCGEFNSGKSSVINALLGRAVLAEGVLPTTNEVSVLRHWSEEEQFSDGNRGGGAAPPPAMRAPDGHFDLRLPLPSLRHVSLVDTPGTNVILERQQRLTEEYVPRADLILFVLSADRPLSDSEVKFLTYLRSWGKDIVFALNKVDALRNTAEVDAVCSFVSSNAERLLGLPPGAAAPRVFPVSSRLAAEAKASLDGVTVPVGRGARASMAAGGAAPPWGSPPPPLASHPAWAPSGFGALEGFIASLLPDSAASLRAPPPSTGAHSPSQPPPVSPALRLKLSTPLSLADALLQAAVASLAEAGAAADAEAAAASAALAQMTPFRAAMERDAATQRARVTSLIDGAVVRAEKWLDERLKLSGAKLLRAATEATSPPLSPLLLPPLPPTSGEGVSPTQPPPPPPARAAAPVSPVVSDYLSTVVGSSADDILALVAEHGAWLERNAARQAAHYAAVAAQRGMLSVQPIRVAASSAVSATPRQPGGDRDAAGGAERLLVASSPRLASALAAASSASGALSAASSFDHASAGLLLAHEARSAARATASVAAASFAAALAATSLLPTLGEDVLSLLLATASTYIGLLNLPLKRGAAKAKLRRAAAGYASQLDAALVDELRRVLDATEEEVGECLSPWRARADEQRRAAGASLAQAEGLATALRALQRRVASL